MYHNSNAFVEMDGIKYFGYELFSLEDAGGRFYEKADTVVDYKVYRKLADLDGSLLDTSAVPKKHSSIFLAPNCPYGIEDVRNNYTLKREADKGDYNVITPLKPYQNVGYVPVKTCAIFPSKRAIVTSACGLDRYKIFNAAQKFIPDLDMGEMLYSTVKYSLILLKDCKIFRMLLNNELSKPCVSYKTLDINSENELTLDVLLLVYKAGTAGRWRDKEDDFIMQLNVLNQHNWREYHGTMALLFGDLLRDGVYSNMRRRPSLYSKAVQELLKCGSKGIVFSNEKDFALAQALVNSLLDVGDCRFTTVKDLINKLRSFHISHDTFNELYNDMVRLTPKAFVDEKKSQSAVL